MDKINNVVSYFDGMSCGQIALEKIGITPVNYYAFEIDKWAMAVTGKNYPRTIQCGSVVNAPLQDLPPIDLLIGGSPCQGFSFAGKQLNFDDPRSKLFFEFAKALKELKPKYFLLENVRMKKESQDIISSYMGVEPVKINSSLFSAQNRVRLYWFGVRQSDGTYKSVELPEIVDKGILLRDVLEDLPGLNEFTPNIDNNKTDSITKKVAKVNPSGRGMNGFVYDTNYKSPTLTTNKGEGVKISQVRQINPSKESGDKQPYQQNRVYHIDGKNPALCASLAGRNNIGENMQLYRKLTPLECERLQTVPDGYTEGVSNTQRYKMLGNGWTVDVVAFIFKHLLKCD